LQAKRIFSEILDERKWNKDKMVVTYNIPFNQAVTTIHDLKIVRLVDYYIAISNYD
jgi:hypothetical protein